MYLQGLSIYQYQTHFVIICSSWFDSDFYALRHTIFRNLRHFNNIIIWLFLLLSYCHLQIKNKNNFELLKFKNTEIGRIRNFSKLDYAYNNIIFSATLAFRRLLTAPLNPSPPPTPSTTLHSTNHLPYPGTPSSISDHARPRLIYLIYFKKKKTKTDTKTIIVLVLVLLCSSL